MSKFQVYVQQLPEQPKEECPCVKECELVFDSLGNTCGCKDNYYGPICSYPGITGWYGKKYCLKFDQDYGSSSDCKPCIGCAKKCDPVTACPFY